MDRDTEGQDSGLGPPGTSTLQLIAEGLAAALGRLEAAGVVLACDAGDLPTTAVQQVALEERAEAVTAELRRLHGEVRRMLARQRRAPAARLSRRAFLTWPGFIPIATLTDR